MAAAAASGLGSGVYGERSEGSGHHNCTASARPRAAMSGLLGKLFGTGAGGKGGGKGPSPQEAIQRLRDTEEMLSKKQEFLEKKIEQELAAARKHGTKNKRGERGGPGRAASSPATGREGPGERRRGCAAEFVPWLWFLYLSAFILYLLPSLDPSAPSPAALAPQPCFLTPTPPRPLSPWGCPVWESRHSLAVPMSPFPCRDSARLLRGVPCRPCRSHSGKSSGKYRSTLRSGLDLPCCWFLILTNTSLYQNLFYWLWLNLCLFLSALRKSSERVGESRSYSSKCVCCSWDEKLPGRKLASIRKDSEKQKSWEFLGFFWE